MSGRTCIGGVLLGLGLLAATTAYAVITALTPLDQQLKAHEFICLAKVDKVHPEKPGVVLVVAEDLKGKMAVRRLAVNLTGDEGAKKRKETSLILKRLAPELPVVLFVNELDQRLLVFAYTNGTWFQMIGKSGEQKDSAVLSFTHAEPFLRRTFKGTTQEMRQVIVDGIAGKKQPPPPNPKEPPGYGPEVGTEKGARAPVEGEAQSGPLFAVIPTIGVGAPLAILALLFPSLFGGVLTLFRRWTAFFTVISVVSMLYLVQACFAVDLYGSWWTSPSGLLLCTALVALGGLLWSWRRNLSYLGQAMPASLERTELLVLLILTASCAAALIIYVLTPGGAADPTFKVIAAFSSGILAGTVYRVYRTLLRHGSYKPPLPTEGIILWGSLLVLITLLAAQPAPAALATEVVAGARPVARLQTDATWNVTNFSKAGGKILSAPRIAGHRAYVSVAHQLGFSTFGAVYRIDLRTQKVLWSFNNDLMMKQVYSSPCLADGHLYIGEGFHDDSDCKVYCLNADTGQKLWEFQTDSQTESTPCVAGGKVYCGGGNDGLYALDAATGKELWRFPGKDYKGRLIRIGASPLVAGDRVYVGSGVDRNRTDDPGETTLFCLDAATGALQWKTPVNLPIWGAAVEANGRIFVGLGNGDILGDAPNPAGAMLCVEGRDGQVVWRTEVGNGVLDRPAVDRHSVYFGSRDRHCYCLNRYTGGERWKKDLKSPVIASPALDIDSTAANATNVFAVAQAGTVVCLDAGTGQVHWSYGDLAQAGTHLSSAPAVSVMSGADGDRRRIYFGAALQNMAVPAFYALEDSPTALKHVRDRA